MIYVMVFLLLCLAVLSVRAARNLPLVNKHKIGIGGGYRPLGTALQTDMYRSKRLKMLSKPMTQAEKDHINRLLEMQKESKHD